jgi:ankyrin repeat protein
MPKPKGAKGNQTWRSQARETALPAQKAELDPLDMEDQADALTMAAMQGNTEAVQALMDRGVSPNAKDTIGVAPLHWGAFCGHAGVVGVLIEAGSEVHCRDQEGRTPLHVAAYESHVDVLKRLLQAGADIAAPDNSESPTADARAQRATGSGTCWRGTCWHGTCSASLPRHRRSPCLVAARMSWHKLPAARPVPACLLLYC